MTGEKSYSEMNESERALRKQVLVANCVEIWDSIYDGDSRYNIIWYAIESFKEELIWVGFATDTHNNNDQVMVAISLGTQIAPQPFDDNGQTTALLFTPEEWTAFAEGAKDGEFNL